MIIKATQAATGWMAKRFIAVLKDGEITWNSMKSDTLAYYISGRNKNSTGNYHRDDSNTLTVPDGAMSNCLPDDFLGVRAFANASLKKAAGGGFTTGNQIVELDLNTLKGNTVEVFDPTGKIPEKRKINIQKYHIAVLKILETGEVSKK